MISDSDSDFNFDEEEVEIVTNSIENFLVEEKKDAKYVIYDENQIIKCKALGSDIEFFINYIKDENVKRIGEIINNNSNLILRLKLKNEKELKDVIDSIQLFLGEYTSVNKFDCIVTKAINGENFYRLYFPFARFSNNILINNLYELLIEFLTNINSYRNWNTNLTLEINNNTIPLYGSSRYNDLNFIFYILFVRDQGTDTILELTELTDDYNIYNIDIDGDNRLYKDLLLDLCIDEDSHNDKIFLPIFLSNNFYKNINSLRTINRKKKVIITYDLTEDPSIYTLADFFFNLIDPKRYNNEFFVKEFAIIIQYLVEYKDPERKKNKFDFDMNKGFKYFLEKINPTEFTHNELKEIFYSDNESDKFLTEKTLAYYAKEDSRQEYDEWNNKWIKFYIDRSRFTSQEHIAQAFYRKNWINIKWITVGKTGKWLICENGNWIENGGVEKVRKKLSKFKNIYANLKIEYNRLAGITDNEMKAAEYQARADIYEKIEDKIMNYDFSNKVIKMSSMFFSDPLISRKLDKNFNLFPLKNKVIEFNDNSHIIRNKKPEDFISIYTNCTYREMPRNHRDRKKVRSYFKKVFPDKDMKHWMMKYIYYTMRGGNNLKIILFCYGPKGYNSKSIFRDFVKYVFGPFLQPISKGMINQLSNSATGLNPQLANLAHARWIDISETGSNDVWDSSSIKLLTGNDMFFARKCCENGEAFYLPGHIVVPTNNLPHIENADLPTKDRTYIGLFKSRFDNNPPESLEARIRLNHFKADGNIRTKLKSIRSAFLCEILSYSEAFYNEGLDRTESMILESNKYWNENDPLHNFIERELIKVDDEKEILQMNRIKIKYDRFLKLNFPQLSTSDLPLLNKKFRSKGFKIINNNLIGVRYKLQTTFNCEN